MSKSTKYTYSLPSFKVLCFAAYTALFVSCKHVISNESYYITSKYRDTSVFEHDKCLLLRIAFAGGFGSDSVSLIINNDIIFNNVIMTSETILGVTGYSVEYYSSDSICLYRYDLNSKRSAKFKHSNSITICPNKYFDMIVISNNITYRYKIRLGRFHYIDISQEYFHPVDKIHISLRRTYPLYD